MDRGCSHSAAAGARGDGRYRLLLVVLAAGLMLLVAQSTAMASKPGCKRPTAITLRSTLVTPTSAILGGEVNACGKKRVRSSFVIGGSKTSGKPVPADLQAHAVAYTLTGLAPGETVTYRVRLKRGRQVILGRPSTFTTPPIVTAAVAASSVTTTSALLNATVNGDGAAGLSVAFVWSTTGGPEMTTAATPLPADLANHSFTFTLESLSPGTTYTFDVIVSSAKRTLARCHCQLMFTTSTSAPTG